MKVKVGVNLSRSFVIVFEIARSLSLLRIVLYLFHLHVNILEMFDSKNADLITENRSYRS